MLPALDHESFVTQKVTIVNTNLFAVQNIFWTGPTSLFFPDISGFMQAKQLGPILCPDKKADRTIEDDCVIL